MDYQLFTFPNCDKCIKVKKYLKEKNIPYHEINAGLGDGKMIFREFYKNNRDKIERDSKGQTVLPILAQEDKIFQGIEKIINNFK